MCLYPFKCHVGHILRVKQPLKCVSTASGWQRKAMATKQVGLLVSILNMFEKFYSPSWKLLLDINDYMQNLYDILSNEQYVSMTDIFSCCICT